MLIFLHRYLFFWLFIVWSGRDGSFITEERIFNLHFTSLKRKKRRKINSISDTNIGAQSLSMIMTPKPVLNIFIIIVVSNNYHYHDFQHYQLTILLLKQLTSSSTPFDIIPSIGYIHRCNYYYYHYYLLLSPLTLQISLISSK